MTTAQDQQSRADFDAFVRTHEQDHGALDEPSALAGWQAARALPAGIEPVGYLIDWPDEPDLGHYFAEEASTTGRSQPLHTAAQVLAMGRVPPQWQAVPVEPTIAMLMAGDMPRISTEQTTKNHAAYSAMLAAAPRLPAAQPDTLAKIAEVAACFGADWPDVEGEPEVLRRVKWAARQLKAAQEHPLLTDERISEIDDETHFHESPDWLRRFARAIEAEARKKPAP